MKPKDIVIILEGGNMRNKNRAIITSALAMALSVSVVTSISHAEDLNDVKLDNNYILENEDENLKNEETFVENDKNKQTDLSTLEDESKKSDEGKLIENIEDEGSEVEQKETNEPTKDLEELKDVLITKINKSQLNDNEKNDFSRKVEELTSKADLEKLDEEIDKAIEKTTKDEEKSLEKEKKDKGDGEKIKKSQEELESFLKERFGIELPETIYDLNLTNEELASLESELREKFSGQIAENLLNILAVMPGEVDTAIRNINKLDKLSQGEKDYFIALIREIENNPNAVRMKETMAVVSEAKKLNKSKKEKTEATAITEEDKKAANQRLEKLIYLSPELRDKFKKRMDAVKDKAGLEYLLSQATAENDKNNEYAKVKKVTDSKAVDGLINRYKRKLYDKSYEGYIENISDEERKAKSDELDEIAKGENNTYIQKYIGLTSMLDRLNELRTPYVNRVNNLNLDEAKKAAFIERILKAKFKEVLDLIQKEAENQSEQVEDKEVTDKREELAKRLESIPSDDKENLKKALQDAKSLEDLEKIEKEISSKETEAKRKDIIFAFKLKAKEVVKGLENLSSERKAEIEKEIDQANDKDSIKKISDAAKAEDKKIVEEKKKKELEEENKKALEANKEVLRKRLKTIEKDADPAKVKEIKNKINALTDVKDFDSQNAIKKEIEELETEIKNRPKDPSEETKNKVLEDIKNGYIEKIQKLKNLSEEEKAKLIEEINKKDKLDQETIKEITEKANEAEKTNKKRSEEKLLADFRDGYKKKIESLANLSDEEKQNYYANLASAKSVGEIRDIYKEALEKSKVSPEVKDRVVNDLRKAYLAELNSLVNLDIESRENFTNQINKATALKGEGGFLEIIDEARKLDKKIAGQKLVAQDARKKFNEELEKLTNLTPSEKKGFEARAQLTDSPSEMAQILMEAREANKKPVEDKKVEIVKVVIPHTTKIIEDSNIEKGKKVVEVVGKDGEKTITITSKLVNGKIVVEKKEEITLEPVEEIIKIGTKEEDKKPDKKDGETQTPPAPDKKDGETQTPPTPDKKDGETQTPPAPDKKDGETQTPPTPDKKDKETQKPSSPDKKDKETQKPSSPDKKDGETQKPSAPNKKDGETQKPSAPDKKDGESQKPSSPDKKDGETQTPPTPDKKDKETQKPSSPDKKDGETQKPSSPDKKDKETQKPSSPDKKDGETQRPSGSKEDSKAKNPLSKGKDKDKKENKEEKKQTKTAPKTGVTGMTEIFMGLIASSSALFVDKKRKNKR